MSLDCGHRRVTLCRHSRSAGSAEQLVQCSGDARPLPAMGTVGPRGLGTTEKTELGKASARVEAGFRRSPGHAPQPSAPLPCVRTQGTLSTQAAQQTGQAQGLSSHRGSQHEVE